MCFDRKEEPQLAEERQSEIDRQNAEILLREISETLPEEEVINQEETTEE